MLATISKVVLPSKITACNGPTIDGMGGTILLARTFVIL